MKLTLLAAALTVLSLGACNTKKETKAEGLADSTKIVSLSGAISEVLAGTGLEKNIVGTDITSNYPESLKAKPKVGHNKNINAEGIMALQPDLVIGIKKDISPALAAQFKTAGVKLLLVDQEFSIHGTKHLISTLTDSLHVKPKGDSLIKVLDADLAKVKMAAKKPKVLFIYARGAGTIMVGGTGTQVESAIKLAGGQNAVTEFPDYKPLTAEALVKANPDVILFFDSGLQSLGGPDGVAKIQGIKETNAGKNKKIISMDGELLGSFGPRLGIAIQELAAKIN
ncbi:iron complex transport system substrate-binding protein [Pedobacter cryoconitis]|uniref:Iron complex transport system substrate-binding protein n=1 Tax=Pedobacter cryoconitis TaxID=188932 RepID=A0A7W8ZJB6_9SPHI|nr:ABC transporter substrate-binding protein [Pedobacter cryoconitis]MBB5634858.1 iron complex transport system substrate-binding protein [Pedobacter cryoconitis]